MGLTDPTPDGRFGEFGGRPFIYFQF